MILTKQKVRFQLLFALLSLICLNTYATDYYVSTTGNDGYSGTSENGAWRHINYAVNYSGLKGGDIIYIKGGNYKERVVMLKSGSIGNNITVTNFNDEIPVIDGTGQSSPNTYHSGLFEAHGSNVTVNGLKVINARFDLNANGIVVIGPVTNVTVQNCITHNTSSSGISIWGGSVNYDGATNIIIQNNDISEAVCGGYQENLSIADGVDNFIIRNNTVHDSHTAPHPVNIPLGIDAKTNVRNGKIYGNHIYNLDYAGGIYVDGFASTAYNIDVYNNAIHNLGHSGLSVAAEQAGGVHHVNFYNNLVYNNAENGIGVNGPNINLVDNLHDINIYNNTFYGNGYYACHVTNLTAKNISVKNNIFSQNKWSNSVTVFTSNKANVAVSNNITNGVQNAWISGMEIVLGTNSIPSDPMFVDASNINFRLTSASPAINKGNSDLAATVDFDGNPRTAGGIVDIGAYEFGSSTINVPVDGITLSSNNFSVNINQTVQIKANITPATATNLNVSWSSNNLSVATVSKNGLVAALAVGNAIITATSEDGQKTATCQVKVVDSFFLNPGIEDDLASGWFLNWGNATRTTTEKRSGSYALQIGPGQGGIAQPVSKGFSAGQKFTLSAYCKLSEADATGGGATIGVVCRNKKNPSVRIATLNSTRIMNTGTFEKTSLTFDIPENTDSMEVNVWFDGGKAKVYLDDWSFGLASNVTVTGILISVIGLPLEKGETFQLETEILPANASNKNVNWTSSDNNIAVVDQTGLVKAISPGIATVTVSSEDGTYSDVCQITVPGTTGIESINGDPGSIQLYPNPIQSGNKLSFSTKGIIGTKSLQILDISGKVIISNKLHEGDAHFLILNKFSGIYIVKILGENQIHTQKLIVY